MEFTTLRKQIYLDQGDEIGYVDLVQSLGTDLTVVNAARASYDKYKVSNEGEMLSNEDKKLIKYLIEHRHTSTLEHNIATFRFKVPLFVAKQHMRHRTWSFNEISRRHTSENIEFWTPNYYRTPDPKNRQQSLNNDLQFNPTVHVVHGEFSMHESTASELQKVHAKNCLDTYSALINAGVCREQARAVLPEMMYTTYWGTIDLNNLVKFLDLREGGDAQWEISQVAKAVHEFAEMLWPETMKNYKTPEQRKQIEQEKIELEVQRRIESLNNTKK